MLWGMFRKCQVAVAQIRRHETVAKMLRYGGAGSALGMLLGNDLPFTLKIFYRCHDIRVIAIIFQLSRH